MAARRRATCFTDAEVRVLLQGIRDYRQVLLSRINTGNMIHKKNEAWERVAADVSALGVALRTVIGVRNKWRDLKKEVLAQRAAASKTGGGPVEKLHPFTDLVHTILREGSALSSGIAVQGTDSSITKTSQESVVAINPVIPTEEYVAVGQESVVAKNPVIPTEEYVAIAQETVVAINPVIPTEEYVAVEGDGAVVSSSVVVSSSLDTIHDVDRLTAGSDPCEVLLASSSPSRPASANANLSHEDKMILDLEVASSVSTLASGARKAGITMTPTARGVKRSAASDKRMKYDAGLEQLSDSQVETDKYRREFYKSATALNNLQIEREKLEIIKLKRQLGLE